jgi:general secretion pathway protein A
MYEKFFNLKTKPFELVPNPEFLFLSRPHKKAMTYLDYGIKEKIGFILLTGEVGSGKTTIIQNLIRGMNSDVKLSKIFNTKLSSGQLLAMINDDFGLRVNGKDKITLLRELNDFLIQQYTNNSQSVLIIDESQNLTPELLEEIRLLSNLETDKSKLLQIILVGQPELRKTLSLPELRQLRQRISITFHIYPLTRKETEEYIFHRLEIAGNREAISFQDGTIDIIHNFSRGIPRLINIICDFLMLSAFVEETKELSLDLVKEVTGELEKENRYWQDEAPETYFSANKDTLKEIVNRVGRLEEESFKKNISENEKIEIFERLSSTETLLNKFITSIKTEMFNLQGKMASSKDEINSIREKIMALGSMAKDIQSELAEFRKHFILKKIKQITDGKRKKGLLRSIFHKQTNSHN